MKEGLEKLLAKAEQVLEDGTYLLTERKSTLSAISRFYYAMFYAAEAAILAVGQEAQSHKGVIVRFGQHLIKTGHIDPKYGKMLSHGFQLRQISDYDLFAEIDISTAQKLGLEARDFVDTIKLFLVEKEYL